MRIPITKYGLPQAAVFPCIILSVMIFLAWAAWKLFPGLLRSGPGMWLALIMPELILLIVLIWVFSFFRDPARTIVDNPQLLLAPADGTITDIEVLENDPEIEGKVLRIGIFLSVFNVHINRMPCAVEVEKITYKPGAFVDARSRDCGKVNEANDLLLRRQHEPKDLMRVRQISGAIARRIVCEAHKGDRFAAGQQFGMIKFGSRTELILPARDNAICLVQAGDKVKAGLTPLVEYTP